ncbi:hypothetical protein BCF74_10643 [Knoellia remsis]|uniref:PH (Pleckstrin Homology) domain-containing protein n=1 Tax=Knoellia remsis TaxID=407159 RepID=A0A2T0UTP6_9MICO|nr:hypothetical protein [Knoellia remsis]PRY61295.1 hypothetical protein BCF74_10643 [Knoellia remsis]
MADERGAPTDSREIRGWEGFESGRLPEPRPVNVHAPWLFILLGVPLLAGLSYGLMQSIWMAISSGNPGEPLGDEGWSVYVAFAWVVALTLLVMMLGSIAVILSFWQRLTTERASLWFLLKRSGTTLTEAGGIEYQQPTSSVAFGRTPARLVILNKYGGIEASYSTREVRWLQVLSNLREWVRARPELPTDDVTRDFFDELEKH